LFGLRQGEVGRSKFVDTDEQDVLPDAERDRSTVVTVETRSAKSANCVKPKPFSSMRSWPRWKSQTTSCAPAQRAIVANERLHVAKIGQVGRHVLPSRARAKAQIATRIAKENGIVNGNSHSLPPPTRTAGAKNRAAHGRAASMLNCAETIRYRGADWYRT
jgi:hypothetical protein